MVTTSVQTETTVVNSMGYKEWWCPCGCELGDCAVAYASKGADSYAASKINIANPGTFDAIEGVAPDWDAINGWKFNGSSHYLNSTFNDTVFPDTRTFIVKFSNYTMGMNYRALLGLADADSHTFMIGKYDSSYDSYINGKGSILSTTYTTSGISATAGKDAYYNGNYLGDVGGVGWLSSSSKNFYIGASNFNGIFANNYANVYIQAVSIYNKILTQAQIQEIGNAMP